MSRALSLFRFIELLLGIPLALRVLMNGNNDWGILYFLFLYVAITAVFFVTALWSFFFRRELRRLAVWVMLLPLALVVLPVIARNHMTEPFSGSYLLGMLAIAVTGMLIWAVVNPRAATGRLPRFFFHSRALNILIVLCQVLAWAVPFAALAFLKNMGSAPHTEQGSPGMGLAYVIVLFAIYFVGLALGSVFAAVWGWIGFRSEIEGAQRTLHLCQMGIALPAIVIGVLVWFWAKGQGVS